jgi:hypothetical protein
MGTVRAKFRVHDVQENAYNDNKTGERVKQSEQVFLSPVYSSDPNTENYSFSQATPSGQISLWISNPGAWGYFERGAEYVIDFNKVEAAVPV